MFFLCWSYQVPIEYRGLFHPVQASPRTWLEEMNPGQVLGANLCGPGNSPGHHQSNKDENSIDAVSSGSQAGSEIHEYTPGFMIFLPSNMVHIANQHNMRRHRKCSVLPHQQLNKERDLSTLQINTLNPVFCHSC